MRYQLPTDRLINCLAPHYLAGRKYILFLQSLVYPLKTLNDRFVLFAKEKQVEARMTSQVMYFEWYLNRKFKKYLVHPEEDIYISESTGIGVDIYHENAQNAKPFTIWHENEVVATIHPEEEPRELYLLTEEKAINKVSFMVCVPEIAISEREFVYMLSYVVNTYKMAGKTYLIKINSKELEPNKKANNTK
jgi:hypothetical protein